MSIIILLIPASKYVPYYSYYFFFHSYRVKIALRYVV